MPKASAPPVEFLCAEFYLRCPIFLENAGFCLCFGKMGMGLFAHSWVRSISFIKKQNGQAKTCSFCFLAEDMGLEPFSSLLTRIERRFQPHHVLCNQKCNQIAGDDSACKAGREEAWQWQCGF